MKKLIGIALLLVLTSSVSANNKGYNEIPLSLILAISRVESNSKDVIGDKHLKNHAYGMFQMRQPAIDDVNRVFGFSEIKKARELRGNNIMQYTYCKLYLIHLSKVFKGDLEKAILAYNMGIGNVRKGRKNKYYDKVKNKIRKEYY